MSPCQPLFDAVPVNERRFGYRMALVTGCGREHGIGLAIAALLIKSGACVAIPSADDVTVDPIYPVKAYF